MSNPTIPEELKGTEKKKADLVFATGPGGKIYAIPTAVAEQYVHSDGHSPVPSLADFAQAANGEGDEVQGHHAALLEDGTVGYHANWAVGYYVWHVDGCTYHGLHRHPFGWLNPLAIDEDDL